MNLILLKPGLWQTHKHTSCICKDVLKQHDWRRRRINKGWGRVIKQNVAQSYCQILKTQRWNEYTEGRGAWIHRDVTQMIWRNVKKQSRNVAFYVISERKQLERKQNNVSVCESKIRNHYLWADGAWYFVSCTFMCDEWIWSFTYCVAAFDFPVYVFIICEVVSRDLAFLCKDKKNTQGGEHTSSPSWGPGAGPNGTKRVRRKGNPHTEFNSSQENAQTAKQ